MIWGGAALLALLALASPALGMRIGNPAIDLPKQPARDGRPWTGSTPSSPAARRRPSGGDRARTWPAPRWRTLWPRWSTARPPPGPIRGPVTAAFVAHGRGLIVNVPLAGNGSDTASTNALLTLRDQVLPATLGRVNGLSYAVTGNTASNYDWSATVHARARRSCWPWSACSRSAC